MEYAEIKNIFLGKPPEFFADCPAIFCYLRRGEEGEEDLRATWGLDIEQAIRRAASMEGIPVIDIRLMPFVPLVGTDTMETVFNSPLSSPGMVSTETFRQDVVNWAGKQKR